MRYVNNLICQIKGHRRHSVLDKRAGFSALHCIRCGCVADCSETVNLSWQWYRVTCRFVNWRRERWFTIKEFFGMNDVPF